MNTLQVTRPNLKTMMVQHSELKPKFKQSMIDGKINPFGDKVVLVTSEIYPPETSFKKGFIKKAEKKLKLLKTGKLKETSYTSIDELRKATS